MNLTETERLVRRIESYLRQPDASLQPDVMAKGYSDEHGAATKRLVTCERIIRGGDHAQALQLAEESPPVLEVIGLLEFRKAKDWVALCRKNGWPVPEPLDRELTRTLQDAYSKGVKADHAIFKRYRGAVLRRNWPQAYEALQSILKVQPKDEGYQKEANRLRNQILDELMKPLGQAVKEGYIKEVLRLSGEIEALPFVAFQPDAKGTVWPRAQCMRCVQLMAVARERREADNCREVLSLTSQIRDLVAQYGLKLPTELSAELANLTGWAVGEKEEHDQRAKHDSLVMEERHLLRQSEERQTARTNPTLAEQKMELETLAHKWREIEQNEGGAPEELQEQYQRNIALLRGQVRRKQNIRRNLIALAAVVTLVLAGVAGFFILEARKADSMAAQLEALIEERKVRAAESLAKSIREKQPRLVGYAKVSAALGQVAPFCQKERDANEALMAKIAGVAEWAGAGFTDPSLEEIQSEINACKIEVKNLPEEFKADTGGELATVENEWELHLDTRGGRRNTEFSALLASAEENVASVKYDLPPAKAAAELERLSQPIKEMQELIPSNLKLMRIKDEYVKRIGLLTNRVAVIGRELETWDSGRTDMSGADGMESYLKGVATIRGSKFATPKQESALTLLLSAEPEKDKLMQALLMPGRDKAWKRFTEDQVLQESPAKLMPREVRLLRDLLRDKNLNELKMGRIREVEYVDLQPVEKDWFPVFVYGGVGSRSESSINAARAGGAEVEVVAGVGRAVKRMEWAVLYDPTKFPDKLQPEYRNLRATKWKFEFITEKGSGIAVSLPETRLLNRTGIQELITGPPETMAGQYLATSGANAGRLTIREDGECSLIGSEFPGGDGSWRKEGVSVQFTLFDPNQNQTTQYTMDWMGDALLAHAVHGRGDFVEKFGEMSAEMLTFIRRDTDGEHVTAAVSIARMMDEVLADKETGPLFKYYLLSALMKITAIRPGEWDTNWLVKSTMEAALKTMEASGMGEKSGSWMVPKLQKDFSAPLEKLLSPFSKLSFGESVRLAHRIVREAYDAGFTLVGFVELDHAGDEQLSLRKPTTKQLWGWDTNGKPGRLFEWDPEKKRHKATGDAMPFSPVYEFNGDVSAIKATLLKGNKTGHEDEVVETWFPPLYQ